MARYRFHATNGTECVFDSTGKDIRLPERVVRRADEVAREVMRSLDDRKIGRNGTSASMISLADASWCSLS